MNYIRIFINLLAVALFLALAPAALASTWYVDGVNGNDQNNCKSWKDACKTIGHAISLASSGDTIKVAAATYTENLNIGTSLSIIGANASTTIVDGGGVNTVFTINSSNATLSNLTIRNGYGYNGGGIYTSGTLTVTHCTVTANRSHGPNGGGGGIFNNNDDAFGMLTISDSTITANASAANGGGIYNGATLIIDRSVVSQNKAKGDGGGILDATFVTNSTITGNSAMLGGGLAGGQLVSNSTVSGNRASISGGNVWYPGTIQNSILANAAKGGNCGGTVTSNGYNLSDDNTCNLNGPGDLNDTKAKLGKLGNYGGPTQTIPEMLNSPTVDAGNPSGCTDGNGNPLTTDQRGYPRPGAHKTDKRCDMGAFERQTD